MKTRLSTNIKHEINEAGERNDGREVRDRPGPRKGCRPRYHHNEHRYTMNASEEALAILVIVSVANQADAKSVPVAQSRLSLGGRGSTGKILSDLLPGESLVGACRGGGGPAWVPVDVVAAAVASVCPLPIFDAPACLSLPRKWR